ncbi:hypothetical protein ACUW6I_002282 [Staphylococcus sp. 093350070-2]
MKVHVSNMMMTQVTHLSLLTYPSSVQPIVVSYYSLPFH